MILTVVLVRGIRESAETNNVMVLLKIAAILAFIFVGMQLHSPRNYHPFVPKGWSGVLTGGSIIFFTYIGFDSVSTAAEEARNPQRDLPIGIIATLIVCTVLYIAVAVVLTGIVPWQRLVDDAAPVVNSLSTSPARTKSALLRWTELAVLFGAMMGMISSLLVFQLGQARVWFSMSRDGLLPTLFSRVHPRFRTPAVATWIAGFLVGIPGGILDIGTLSDLSNIGTLFAFVLVSIGVIILRYKRPGAASRLPRSRRPGGADSQRAVLRAADGRPADPHLAALFRLADHRPDGYFLYSRHRSEFCPRGPAGAKSNRMTESLQGAGTPSAYILSLPKAELHLHLEGTVDPATLAELSRRHPNPLSTNNNRYTNIADSGRVFTEDEARALYQYKNFTGFLLAFKAVTRTSANGEDYELVTYRMMQRLHGQNVLHAEVYVRWRHRTGAEVRSAPLFEGLDAGRTTR